jgi:hypothetical protein
MAEVFFAGDNWPQSMAFPGQGAVDSQSAARCEAAFTAYDGLDLPISAFMFGRIDPGASDWASGSRFLACYAFDGNGWQENYSIKDRYV